MFFQQLPLKDDCEEEDFQPSPSSRRFFVAGKSISIDNRRILRFSSSVPIRCQSLPVPVRVALSPSGSLALLNLECRNRVPMRETKPSLLGIFECALSPRYTSQIRISNKNIPLANHRVPSQAGQLRYVPPASELLGRWVASAAAHLS